MTEIKDYSRAKIYKLLNTIDYKIYVGSTIQKLCERMSDHRSDCRFGGMSTCYKHCREIGLENVYIELIELFPCKEKNAMLWRERYWTEKLEAELNDKKAIVSEKEKKEYKKEYNRKYYLRKKAEKLEKLRIEREAMYKINIDLYNGQCARDAKCAC